MDFQTPNIVCEYMVDLLAKDAYGILLEPTPGQGNLVKAMTKKACHIDAPTDFFTLTAKRYDAVVMNPPFTPMELGYKILFRCLDITDEIVALMPWLTLINSKKRTDKLIDFGMVSVTHLPRSIFKGARVQCCVIHLMKGHSKPTIFKNYALTGSDLTLKE